ncbi:MAG: uroporphyrinogen-III synthase [Pseudomonadota bacterium]|nr:uroporphyrinogen-III synthase [Pseudomonadota bacterium]
MTVHVLNTRPQDRAQPLTHALQMAGYQVSELPLLAFDQLRLSAEQLQDLEQVATYDWVIVISPLAAQLGLAQLQQLGLTLTTLPTRWLAVGQATATVLRQAGLQPIVPCLETSEGVVELSEITALQPDQRVLIWRGEGGRELIQQTLRAQQIFLRSVAFYRRVCPPNVWADWQAIVRQNGVPDVVLISSGEAWRHWQQTMGQDATAPWLLVLGQRVYRQLAQSTRRLSVLENLQPKTICAALALLVHADELTQDTDSR